MALVTNSGAYIKSLPRTRGAETTFIDSRPFTTKTDLYSLGEDGISKTGENDRDDINNWNTNRPWARQYNRWRWAPDRFEFALLIIGVVVIGAYIIVCGLNPISQKHSS